MDTTTYFPTVFDSETTTFEPPVAAVKPAYFQAYDFSDILAKLDPEIEDNDNLADENEAEPSNVIANCMQEFLVCIQSHSELDSNLAKKAGKCYFQYQDCSGSVILVPDLK